VDSYSARPGHAAPGFLTPIDEMERGLQLGPDRLRNSGRAPRSLPPWSSRRSESRLIAPERGLERGRRGVSFRQCRSGAAAYRVRESGDTKVWLRHLFIHPCFYARPDRCIATSGMLLSFVDFFRGLSSETPEKTRISREAQSIREEKEGAPMSGATTAQQKESKRFQRRLPEPQNGQS
jgi:hypothetical protein